MKREESEKHEREKDKRVNGREKESGREENKGQERRESEKGRRGRGYRK